MTARSRSAYEQLVEAHMGMAIITAQTLMARAGQNCGLDLGDFIGAAHIGLCRAAERFDASRGIQFPTYAITMMRGAILEQLRNWDWVPRAVRERVRAGLAAPIQHPCSLDAHAKETPDGDSVGELFVDEAPGPEELALEAAQKAEILEAITRLPVRERIVIERYYMRNLTLKQIAETMEISESRAFQLRHQALNRLRLDLRADFDDVLCDRPGEV